MAKTYNHAVIYNGVFYPANTPIKETKTTVDEAPKQKKEGAKNDKGTV